MANTPQLTAVVFILVFEALFCFIFGFFVDYEAFADTKSIRKADTNVTTAKPNDNEHAVSYAMFMDVQVMIFFGFGFIVTFLKKYGYSALGFSFLISILVIQLECLSRGIYDPENDKIVISLNTLIESEVAAATVLISFGAVLGKVSPSQLIFMAFAETMFSDLNEYINKDVLKGVDAGGAIYVHVFGAYFGLAVSLILTLRSSTGDEENQLRASSYQGDIFAMIGTLFLWVCWPSFLAATMTGDTRWRTVLNTYFALLTSSIVAFAMSALFNKQWKFEMAHIQNATLAGGVAVGTVCNMVIRPFGAVLTGIVAAFICVIGFKYIQGFLRRKLRIDDVCGVHNLHGMPGIFGGLLGVIMAGVATRDTYGESLKDVFPAMGPTDFRGAGTQAAIQVAIIGVTLGISIVGGLLTGVFLAYVFKPVQPEQYFDDDNDFITPGAVNEQS